MSEVAVILGGTKIVVTRAAWHMIEEAEYVAKNDGENVALSIPVLLVIPLFRRSNVRKQREEEI